MFPSELSIKLLAGIAYPFDRVSRDHFAGALIRGAIAYMIENPARFGPPAEMQRAMCLGRDSEADRKTVARGVRLINKERLSAAKMCGGEVQAEAWRILGCAPPQPVPTHSSREMIAAISVLILSQRTAAGGSREAVAPSKLTAGTL